MRPGVAEAFCLRPTASAAGTGQENVVCRRHSAVGCEGGTPTPLFDQFLDIHQNNMRVFCCFFKNGFRKTVLGEQYIP